MALLKSLALGAIAAISLPHVLRGEGGMLGEAMRSGTVQPVAGTVSFPFSVPIFLGVALITYILFRAAET